MSALQKDYAESHLRTSLFAMIGACLIYPSAILVYTRKAIAQCNGDWKMSSRCSTRKRATARWRPGKAGGIRLSFSSPSKMARFMPIPLHFSCGGAKLGDSTAGPELRPKKFRFMSSLGAVSRIAETYNESVCLSGSILNPKLTSTSFH
jgi:hypothetical protein